MEGSVECSICAEFYVSGTRPPKTLPCGHSFCVVCLHSMYTERYIVCPKCRTACSVPNGSIARLTTNFSLLELVESLCGDCHAQPHTNLCNHCDKNVCNACREAHMAAFQDDISDNYNNLKDLVELINSKLVDDRHLQAITTRRDQVLQQLAQIRDEQRQQIEQMYQDNVAKVTDIAQEDLDRRLTFNETVLDIVADSQKELERIKKQRFSRSSFDRKSVKIAYENKMKTLRKIDKIEPSSRIVQVKYNGDQSKESLMHSLQLIIASNPSVLSASRPIPTDRCDLSQHPCGSASALAMNEETDYAHMTSRSVLHNEIGKPWGICTNHDTGDILVTDLSNHCIHVLDDSLRLLRSFTAKGAARGLKSPTGVACDGRNVYIVDSGHHHVYVTDLQGKVLRVIGAEGSGLDGFKGPSSLALDASGNIFVCDSLNNRIKVTTNQGIYLREFGRGVFGGVNPWFISVSADQKVAVTDWSGNLHMFTTSGSHLKTINVQSPPLDVHAVGVVFGGHGNIILSDEKKGVVVLRETGELVHSLGTAAVGQLKWPQGLTLTQNNDVVVCDLGYNRLQLFTANS